MNITEICNSITNAINKVRAPLAKVPALLLVASTINRPGLSPMTIASRIIKRQAEAGAPYGPAADGTPNIAEAMEVIRIEEIIYALKMESVIQIGIPIGGIQVMTTGANAGGAIVTQGYNTNMVKGTGIQG